MKRIYKPYTEWEDYLNGMWRKLPPEEENTMLEIAIKFTGNAELYGKAMEEVVKAWPITMQNTLSNTSVNRKAFLGHCAVQYKINCPEYITRMAWKYLSTNQRHDANKKAEINIKHWENEIRNKPVHKTLGKQLLLEWPS
jgi:hypothetical protein